MMQELFLFPTANQTKSKRQRKVKTPKDPNAPRKLSIPQQIITKLVIDMKGCYDPARWKEEMRHCTNLRKIYKDEFLLWVSPLEGRTFNSLLFYFTVLGRNYLSDQLFEFAKLNPPTTEISDVPLSPTKIGEDTSLIRQPRTLKEFLNYGKNISK